MEASSWQKGTMMDSESSSKKLCSYFPQGHNVSPVSLFILTVFALEASSFCVTLGEYSPATDFQTICDVIANSRRSYRLKKGKCNSDKCAIFVLPARRLLNNTSLNIQPEDQ